MSDAALFDVKFYEFAEVEFGDPTAFKIVKELGRGAFGSVTQVIHLPTSRRFAEKRLYSTVRNANDEEAVNAMRLVHPALVKTYHARKTTAVLPATEETGYCAGWQTRLMMEMMDGTLTSLIERHAMDGASRVRAVCDILYGLAFLHSNGLVHCDVKPDNVLYNAAHRCKIADLGMASRIGAPINGGSRITMAPESQLPTTTAHPSQDMFSVGAIIYFMLTTTGSKINYLVNGRTLLSEASQADIASGLSMPMRNVELVRLATVAHRLIVRNAGARPSAISCLAYLLGKTDDPTTVVNYSSLSFNESGFEESIVVKPLSWTRYIGHALLLSFIAAVIAGFIYVSVVHYSSVNGAVYALTGIAVAVSLVVGILTFGMFHILSRASEVMLVFSTITPIALLIGATVFLQLRPEYSYILIFTVVYSLVKVLTFYWAWKRMRNSTLFISLARPLLSPRSLLPVFAPWIIGYIVQVCLMFVGGTLFGSNLRNESSVPSVIGIFVAYMWLVNLVRYLMHYVFVVVYTLKHSRAVVNVPVLSALRHALTDNLVGLCFCAVFVFIAPAVLFASDWLFCLAIFVFMLSFLSDRCCDNSRACACIGFLLLLIRQGLNLLSGVLTKTNLTQIAMTQKPIWEAIRFTYHHLPVASRPSVFGDLFNDDDTRDGVVTDSFGSSLIGHMCMAGAALMLFASPIAGVDRAALYGAFVAYVLTSTLLEPLDSYIYLVVTAGLQAPNVLGDIIHGCHERTISVTSPGQSYVIPANVAQL